MQKRAVKVYEKRPLHQRPVSGTVGRAFVVKRAQPAHPFVRPPRFLGSAAGPAAPNQFGQQRGGPLTGALSQAALLALLGMIGGKGVNRLMGTPDARWPGLLAAGGAALPLLLHSPRLLANYRDGGLSNLNWSVGRMDPSEGRPRQRHEPAAPIRRLGQVLDKEAGVKRAGRLRPGQAGFGIPTAHTRSMIITDPYLSSMDKIRALRVLDEASESERSGLTRWPNLARAAVGGGTGWAAGTVGARVADAFFGGVAPSTQKTLQRGGMVAGVLKGFGII